MKMQNVFVVFLVASSLSMCTSLDVQRQRAVFAETPLQKWQGIVTETQNLINEVKTQIATKEAEIQNTDQADHHTKAYMEATTLDLPRLQEELAQLQKSKQEAQDMVNALR